MKIIADLHIHSKYSRAVSGDMTLENIASHARKKGIQVVATGDFTHPACFGEIKNNNDCPRYMGRIISGVKIGVSPKRIRERLRTCGLEPINNVVDAANYVMLELGQPLHAFDLGKISGKKIVVRRAKAGESIDALDDKKYKLDKKNLVIADSKKILAIAGIKGGKSAAIDENTKDIFIESANFEPVMVRLSSQGLKLKTDASVRFEHGADPNFAETALDSLAVLIEEVAGGKIIEGKIDIYPKKLLPKKLKLDLEKIESILGIKIGQKEVIRILNFLGLETKADLTVAVPTWRPDLAGNEDFAEETGRIYGYEKLKSVYPRLALIPAKKNDDILWEEKIKDFLKEAGFSETYGYSFISKRAGDAMEGKLVELENPFSEQFYYLRPNLLLNLYENAQYNSRNLNPEKMIKIFEIGNVFNKRKEGIMEKKMLSAIMAGENEESFYVLKGVVDSLFEKAGISDYYFDDYQATPEDGESNLWEAGERAEIKIGDREVGFLGKLNFPVFNKDRQTREVYALNIDFDALVRECNDESEYEPISKFPAAVRDVALLVPGETRVGEVLDVINAGESRHIRDVDLFDLYEGPELPEGKKNLAFHIIFQAKDRTLTGREIDSMMAKIIQQLEDNSGWEVRKTN